jgi:transcriptional regulator, deoR family
MTAYAPGLSAKEVQALDAAKLYYAGLSQQEVAQRLHVSRPTVSKLLAYARRRGFVRIEIHDPREQDPMLLDTLRERFDLLDVRLVSPVGPGEDLLRAALGREGARLLSSLVRDGDRIGAVGSRTLVELARSLEPVHRHHVELIQMARGLLPAERGLDEEACLVRMAQAFDAHLHLLDMPLVLGSIAERNDLHRAPRGRRVMEMVDQARIALFTVGEIHSDLQHLGHEVLSAVEREALIERGAGDLCSHFIDVHGRICLPDLTHRTTGITLAELRSKEQRILVAGGEAKAPVMRAALANGYVNRLITDVSAARGVLEIDDAMAPQQ